MEKCVFRYKKTYKGIWRSIKKKTGKTPGLAVVLVGENPARESM